jgi:pantoate--beta-alanine ligase
VTGGATTQPAAAQLVLARTKAELASARGALAAPVVLVPTMGALHPGHRTLLRAARALAEQAGGEQAGAEQAGGEQAGVRGAGAGRAGQVVVSIFVNPLQFGPSEDLDRYPRTLDEDLAICAAEGVSLVFAPSAAEMYPGGQPEVTVDPGPAGQLLEGQFRPGFFDGVLTVVLKLLHLARPEVVVFGQKDAQQLALVRRMVADMDLGIAVESVPTARDADGLATSSRNRYLTPAERAMALAIPRALHAGQARAEGGSAAVLDAAWQVLRATPGLTVDYLALVDPRTFTPVLPGQAGPGLLLTAARVGGTRLIDNVLVVLPAAEGRDR